MDAFLETVEKIWENSFVRALVFLLIAFIAAALASFIVKKLFKLIKLDGKFDKWGINEGQNGTATKFIGKLVFLIVFLLFLPAVLSALGLESVSKPITDFANTFISYFPNIIAAAILIFIGIFLGGILGDVISVLLNKTSIDTLTEKFSGKSGEDETIQKDGMKISKIVGKTVNWLVILLSIVQALTVLDIEAISAPALSVINAVFGAIPSIILAFVVIAVGLIIANIACAVLENILNGINFDGILSKIMPNAKLKFSITRTVVGIVRVLIILFVFAQGIEILKLELLTNIISVIIAYLPMVIKAAIIAIAAFLGAGIIESIVAKAIPSSKVIPKILKIMIYVVAGFMILSQLGFASVIVNYAFIIILSSVAVAFAIAFGIGGRDFAKKTLDNIKISENKEKNNNT